MKILYKFAEQQDINRDVVDEFLKEESKIETIEDLYRADPSILEHYDYCTELPDKLKDFIYNEMWTERYMTIELDTVLEVISDRKEYYDRDELDVEEIIELPIERSEINKKLCAIEQVLVDIKFGSVVWDW